MAELIFTSGTNYLPSGCQHFYSASFGFTCGTQPGLASQTGLLAGLEGVEGMEVVQEEEEEVLLP